MRVAWQAGVLLALEEAGIAFDHADGISGGTMNLAMLLSRLTPAEMCERWRTVPVRDFASLLPLEEYLKAGELPAMGDADGIIGSVFPHLGIDAGKIRAHRGMVGTFNVCNFTRKTNEAIPHNEIDLDLLVAGISLPIFMPPVKKNGFLYTDSVWIKDANLMEAVRRGSGEIWLLWCIGNTAEYCGGAFRQYVHMIEMSANGALFEEFERIREMGRPIRLHVIKPEYPLPLDPDLFLGKIDAATLIDRGYADAKRYLDSRKPEGVRLDPEATRMQVSPSGIAFRGAFSGSLQLGESDVEAGKQRGEPFSLHAAVQIRDWKRFAASETPSAELTAHFNFAPFGRTVLASSGSFRVEPHATGKRVVYEVRFEHQRRPYCLRGELDLHHDAGLQIWNRLTTMPVRLYEGTVVGGPVAGAGVLEMKMLDLPKFVSSLHATDTANAGESARLVAKFGSYLLGELWDAFASRFGQN